MARLNVTFRSVFANENGLAPGGSVVSGAHIGAPSAIGVGENFRAETNMNDNPIYSHSSTGVGFGEQAYSRVPVCAAVGRAEVKHTRSVAVRVGIRLTAKDMDSIADGHDIGAANFLSGLGDANRAGPSRAVVGGFAKVQRLADGTHVTGGSEEIDGVANGVEPTVLHRIIPRRRGNDGWAAPCCSVVLR